MSDESSGVSEANGMSVPDVVMGGSHIWNDAGETCIRCGDKDWMADKYCSARLTAKELRNAIKQYEKETGLFWLPVEGVKEQDLYIVGWEFAKKYFQAP